MTDKKKLERIKRLANNVLYFDDSNDYQAALWTILEYITPHCFDGMDIPELKYIEDDDRDEVDYNLN